MSILDDFIKDRTATNELLLSNSIVSTGGHLGLPRSCMPQIDDIESFIQQLTARGIAVEYGTVDAKGLKMTQREFNHQKVISLMVGYRDGTKERKPSIVTSDGFVLDGTHRFLADYNLALQTGESTDIEVILVDAEIQTMLSIMSLFSGINYRGVNEVKLDHNYK